MIVNPDKLGFYLVGWKKFHHKALACIESKKTGYDISWIFNDQVFDSYDWTKPIETQLFDLYVQRARQLREKYDYLVLYYSGGADSTNALHAFIDNGILIDEIVLTMPKVVEKTLNDHDFSNANYFSEVKYAGMKHLKQYENLINRQTKITIHDYTVAGLPAMGKEYWLENTPLCISISISGILRQISQDKASFYQDIMNAGRKTAFIFGVDKPMVWCDGHDYFAYFIDTGAYHYATPFEFSQSNIGNISTEFFYWTPDLPEIVIKQAQLIKQRCQTDRWAKIMIMQSLRRHISDYRDILHPVIYPKFAIEPFQTEKPTTNIIRPMDGWFWSTTDRTTQQNYLGAVDHLRTITDEKHMIKQDISNGIAASLSKFYKL